MKNINLKDFKIIPLIDSAERLKISDEVYFSKKYENYISNSKLSIFNPEQGGDKIKYKNNWHQNSTQSLVLGSAIHECVLQSEYFSLGPKCDKPTAKLGNTIDKIKYYRKQGKSIYDSIKLASIDCDYYINQIDNKINKIIFDGFKYYWESKDYPDNLITLSNKDHEACKNCVNNINKDKIIQSKLHPKNVLGDYLQSYNEDALFLDILITYKEKYTILKLKMKADNWTIDEDNKILTLNDLKTTSKPVAWFMNNEYGSFYKFHYYRQFALYKMILEQYCIKEFGFNYKWKSYGNVLVVNTQDYNTRCCQVYNDHIKLGKIEYEKLLKQIAYYEIFGYEEDVNFI